MSETNSGTNIPTSTAQKVSADGVLATLDSNASSPMDFINRNLKKFAGNEPPAPPPPAPVVPEPPKPLTGFDHKPIALKDGELPDDLFNFNVTETPIDAPPTEGDPAAIADPPIEEPPVDDSPDDEIPEEEVKLYSEKANKRIRDLVKSKKEFATKAETAEAERLKALEELEGYKTGAVVPDVVRAQEEKIVELTKYQRLHDIQNMEEYRRDITVPLDSKKQDARDHAAKHKVNAGIFDVALTLSDEPALDEYLSEQFGGNAIAALEAKNIIKDIQGIAGKMRYMETASANELKLIQDEYQLDKARQQTAAIEKISKSTKTHWVSAIKELQATNQFPELMLDPTDEEHNKIVRPILDESAREYARIVKSLVANGLRELPDDVAKVLAKYIPLGRAASLTAASRESYRLQAEQVEKNAQRTSGMRRPTIGGMSPGTGSKAPAITPPGSPAEAAQLLSKQFLQKK